jgi:tight adherence protein C
MNPALALALLSGVTLGGGLWLLVSSLPRVGRPPLTVRLAPYLVDVSSEARAMVRPRQTDPLPIIGVLLAPVIDSLTRALEAVLGGSAVIRLRLRQAGSTASVSHHRTRQLMAASLGAAAGGALGATLARDGAVTLAAGTAGVLAGAAAAIAVTDALLARAAARRVAALTAELPTVVELLALSVSAGEPIADALRRIATAGSGQLAEELGRVVTRTGTGQPLARSLAEFRDDLSLPAVTRLVDQVLSALDRGTPLAEVLRAQARDAREESKRQVIESAGKREIAMLIPLVFLILPVTVLFAVWPGLMVLQVGF